MSEAEAYEFVESKLWPNGPVCPRCRGGKATKLRGRSTRYGVYKCRPCRKPFRVTVGTPIEQSHVPLQLWVIAVRLFQESGKMSCYKLSRLLGISIRPAWEMNCKLAEVSSLLAERGR